MIRAVVVLALASSCATMRTFDCGVGAADVEGVRAQVASQYPDALEIFDRMDVFCVDDTNTFQTCGRAGYRRTEGCTAWIGGGPYRGRMHMDLDEDFASMIMHEAQHWHLMQLNGDDGCPTHEAACGWKD
jgi:hypothetical protein